MRRKKSLDKMGDGEVPVAAPSIPQLPDNRSSLPEREALFEDRELTPEEWVKTFGVQDTVVIHLLPLMLAGIALEQAEKYVNYCRDNRLSDYKRHNREMRHCIEEYDKELRYNYGYAWDAYRSYLDKFRQTVKVDLFQMWCTFTNEASRQFKGVPHKDIPALVTFTKMVLTYIEVYQKKIDEMIVNRLERNCKRKQNPWLALISVLCVDIAETFGHKMEITETMLLCIKILVQRCEAVVKEIVAEEDAAERAMN